MKSFQRTGASAELPRTMRQANLEVMEAERELRNQIEPRPAAGGRPPSAASPVPEASKPEPDAAPPPDQANPPADREGTNE
jgi:hypothetical protein